MKGKAFSRTCTTSLRNAQVFIHMETYIIRNDSLGRELIQLLAEKARQGVEVKLLYDGMGCIRLPWHFFDPLLECGRQHGGVFPAVAALYQPAYQLSQSSQNLRD